MSPDIATEETYGWTELSPDGRVLSQLAPVGGSGRTSPGAALIGPKTRSAVFPCRDRPVFRDAADQYAEDA